MAGSPEVKALGGQVDAEPPRSDHPRGQTTRRAVARANGLVAEMGSRVKMICGIKWRCQGFLSSTRWPGPTWKNWGKHMLGLPAEAEGGNSGEFSSESPEGLTGQAGWSLNAKDRPYNRLRREMGRRQSDRRKGSISDEGWDNITQLERGPLGPGRVVELEGPHTEVGEPLPRRRLLRLE